MRLKLLEYDTVRAELNKKYKETRQLIQGGETHLDNLAEGFLEADRVIWSMPTIDAVPVVRCKDCRFDGDEDDCPLLSVAAYTNPDDFCSYGERKEGSDVEGDRGV